MANSQEHQKQRRASLVGFGGLLAGEELLILLLGLDEGLLEEVGVLAVAEADGEGLGLGLTLTDIGGRVPYPRTVGADVWRELHVGDDCVSQSVTWRVLHQH